MGWVTRSNAPLTTRRPYFVAKGAANATIGTLCAADGTMLETVGVPFNADVRCLYLLPS